MARFGTLFPYILFGCMAALVVWSNLRPAPRVLSDRERVVTHLARNVEANNPDTCMYCGMTVAIGEGVAAEMHGRRRLFCCDSRKDSYLNDLSDTSLDPSAIEIKTENMLGSNEHQLDPVCHMEVNSTWGFIYTYQGTTFHFCTERCKEIFVSNPEKYVGERCMVCGTSIAQVDAFPATYLDRTYYLCSEAHRENFLADPAGYFLHRMWGIPDWLYYLSISLVLLVSFALFERWRIVRSARSLSRAIFSGPGRSRVPSSAGPTPDGEQTRSRGPAGMISMIPFGRGSHAEAIDTGFSPSVPAGSRPTLGNMWQGDRIDLMRIRLIKRLVLSRPLRFCVQFIMAVLFLLIIAAGLFGNQNPALNIGPLLTWTIWWCGLVILIMFVGKAWCYMCPWDAIATWLEKRRLWKKTDQGLGLDLPWPVSFRNIWLATALFVGLTWIELGFGVTMRPRVTAYLAIAILVLTIVSVFLFDRKSFCRYGCLVGRVSGLYALFSGMEIRNRSVQTCTACRSKECIRGTDAAYGCPTFEYPGNMKLNTYCIQCTECLQACPHDNLAVNLRPWGADLASEGKPRADEAYLALLMLSITGFHGLTMTPVWQKLVASIQETLPVGRIIAFSAGMFSLLLFPILIYAGLVWISHKIATHYATLRLHHGSTAVTYREYFIRYAYCVLPIALFYHLAHNLEHLLMEGPKIITLLSDPFGWGWNLFHTAGWRIPPLAPLHLLWFLQVILVGVGHVYSLWVAQKISHRVFPDETAASRGQLPMLVGMIAFSLFSLWLLKLPMEMRTSAM